MEKENLKITKEYFEDLGFYHLIIEKYNLDNVLLEPFYAVSEEELRIKAFKAIADYESEDIEDVVEEYGQQLKFNWEGVGYYDIQSIYEGFRNGIVARIEDIMDTEVYDINLKKLFKPEKIEEEYGGKIYGIFGCDIVQFPPQYKTKYIIVDDLKNRDKEIEEPFSILEAYGIEPHAYGISSSTNNWHNYVWQRVIDFDNDRLLDFLIDINEEIEVIYLSKL